MKHKTQNWKQKTYARGQAALTAVLLFVAISTILSLGLSALALGELNISKRELRTKKSYFLAEASAEDVAYRLSTGKQVSSTETLSLDGSTASTTITNLINNEKEVVSTGDVSSNMRRVKLKMRSAPGASFNYGVQIGNGGLDMANSSKVIGNVYSNGNMLGTQSANITGDAFAASSSGITGLDIDGNARAYSIANSDIGKSASSTTNIDDTVIGKNAYADTITGNEDITRDAYYQTSIAPSVNVGGLEYPGTPAPSTLPTIPMPITDTLINDWETVAVAGGTISSPCPYKPVNGTSLGPKKIACDMEIDGTKIITLTGPLWITGNLSMSNSAQLNLASSYGSYSEVVIVDNPSNRLTSSKVTLNNSVQLTGSGTAGSYILLISQNNSAESSGSEKAIDTGQSGAAPIYYAPHGLINISNNNTLNLREVTGYKISLSQSTQVTYESGLANMYFPSGPAGGLEILSWREVE